MARASTAAVFAFTAFLALAGGLALRLGLPLPRMPSIQSLRPSPMASGPMPAPTPVWSVSSDLPLARVGEPFAYRLKASVPGSGLLFAMRGQPSWLSMSRDGVLMGVPDRPGDFRFEVKAYTPSSSSILEVLLSVDPSAQPGLFSPGSPDVFAFFALGSASLAPQAREAASQAASLLPSGGSVSLVGHADQSGSASYDMALGMRRAKAFSKALEGFGVGSSSISVSSMGKSKPLVDVGDGVPDARNRRVEVFLSLPTPSPRGPSS